MERFDLRRGAFRRMAEERERLAAEAHGRFTANPEPPGDGWRTAFGDADAFAAAGLCEVWRMDLGDETRFVRFADLPPGFNLSGLWWRPA